MPRIDLDILNQKQTPAFYASSLATRPAASFVGRIFIDSDSPSTGLYRDTGTAWVQIADPGAGTTGTLEQVTTNGNTTDKGISITAGGLTSNTVSIVANGLSSTTNYIGQTMAINDSWKIYGTGTTLDQGEMVFEVGDNGTAYATNGERFRFSYDASSSGTAKDVLVVDYTSSYFNTNLGINTITPSSPFDIHTATGINATFNGTGTTNSALQLQSAGVGKWNLSNFYNAGANDFIVRDFTNSLNRITVKNTGQTFIGADTTSSGLLVVNSATSDNHFVAIGANAPSLRLRDAGSGGVLNCGIGISTGANNFIQSSVNGNYCIFNSSTTASPILFGIYDAGTSNTQEAARISAARNLLVGTSTDGGYKLSVSGTANFTGQLSINNSLGLSLGNGTGLNWSIYKDATTNSLSFYNNGVVPFFTIASTGAATFSSSVTANTLLSVNGASSPFTTPSGTFRITNTAGGTPTQINMGVIDSSPYAGWIQAQHQTLSGFYYPLLLNPQGGNVLIGTTTDAGYKLDVNGTGRFSSTTSLLYLNATNTNGASGVFSTENGTNKWAFGNNIGTGDDAWSVYNFGASARYFTIASTGAATFSGAIAIANTVAAAVAAPSTHKVSILINGVQYYLLASNI